MKSFQEWVKLNETMDVQVHGHDYASEIKDLEDLTRHLKWKTIDSAFEKLEPDQQNAIRHQGHPAGSLTPDGAYYTNGTEVINFYTGGWGNLIPKMIEAIKYHLDDMGVKYGPFKIDKSGMFGGDVVRIPILSYSKTEDSPPVLNLSNANAHLIFNDLLGFPGEEGGYFDISPADLYRKIEGLEKYQLDLHARDDYSTKQKGGGTMHHMGLSSDAIQQRLAQLKQIAKWAMERHYDNISVV